MRRSCPRLKKLANDILVPAAACVEQRCAPVVAIARPIDNSTPIEQHRDVLRAANLRGNRERRDAPRFLLISDVDCLAVGTKAVSLETLKNARRVWAPCFRDEQLRLRRLQLGIGDTFSLTQLADRSVGSLPESKASRLVKALQHVGPVSGRELTPATSINIGGETSLQRLAAMGLPTI